ncbi:nitrogen regulatory IIA protein [Sphingobacterium sp. Mn56C]|uniref:nitrogen regulatory IIA protein n=1 Tax=Sphingobacterium sp. Mn56C TaxID=3395261 RepID=UPI003BEA1F2C
MKKIRANIDEWIERLDQRWRILPLKKQHQYILYFFIGYLLLTAGVICKVWYDTSKSGNEMVIEHIENPTLNRVKNPARMQDTLSRKIKK